MTSEAFDAAKYCIDLPKRKRGENGQWVNTTARYLEVSNRLLWLRTVQPDAVIKTELVQFDSDHAVVRAEVTLPAGGSATGYGFCDAGSFGAYLEKAETKAIGRALAALGYGTQFCGDEFDSDDGDPSHLPDTPQEIRRPVTRAAAPQGGSLTLLATEPQLKAIYAIARGAQSLDDAELDGRCRERYGCPPQELTRRQASEFIDALKVSQPKQDPAIQRQIEEVSKRSPAPWQKSPPDGPPAADLHSVALQSHAEHNAVSGASQWPEGLSAKPGSIRVTGNAAPSADQPASLGQLKQIKAIGRAVGEDEESLNARAQNAFGCVFTALTGAQANDLIQELRVLASPA